MNLVLLRFKQARSKRLGHYINFAAKLSNPNIPNQENTRGQRGTVRALVVICHRLFLVSRSLFSETSTQITTSI